MATDFSFSDEEKDEKKKEAKTEEPFVSPEEPEQPETTPETPETSLPTPPATPEPESVETEKRKCILCGAEMKSDLGFICNECRDRLLAKTRLGPETLSEEKSEEKTKTIKF